MTYFGLTSVSDGILFQLECSESLTCRTECFLTISEKIELDEFALVSVIRSAFLFWIHSEAHKHLCAGIEQICRLFIVVLGIVGSVYEGVFDPLRLW